MAEDKVPGQRRVPKGAALCVRRAAKFCRQGRGSGGMVRDKVSGQHRVP